jgi:hypothetical protein
MPRPKRTKITSTTTTTTRVVRTTKAATPAPRQQQNVTKIPERVESTLSDDSDGLVVKETRARRRMPWQPEPQKDVDLTMTGALPAKVGNRIGRTPGRRESPRVVISSGTRRVSSSDASRETRTSNGSSNTEAQELSPTEARPVVALNTHDGLLEDDDSTGFGDNLLTFSSLDSDSPAHGTRPPSAMKVGATPSHEISTLALTNFKRRVRQPSLIRMVHQTTDVEDNDLSELGTFDDLDDFHPEHESTPLHVHKSTEGAEVEKISGLSLHSSASRGRKRKLSSPVIQVPRSSPPYDPPSGADVTESRATSPSLPDDVVESRETVVETQEEADPDNLSETLAPPRSSSPPVEDVEESSNLVVKSRQRRTRGDPKKADMEQDSDVEELGLRSKAKSKNKPKAQQGISTAKLQALLPRRRIRVPQERDEYDIQDSDEVDDTPIDSDQDELQMPNPRRAPAVRKAGNKKLIKKATRTAKKARAPSKISDKNTRTYSRRISSDKENEGAVVVDNDSEGAEETTETSIVLPGPQLEAIAKKFEDVDAWEMDFESVDANGDDSSPWR